MAEFINIEDSWIGEADSSVNFRVWLDGPATQSVSVDWTTSGSGASANSLDFVVANGTVTFAPGEAEKVISVALRDNATVEALESFHIQLSNAAGAALSRSRGTAVIVDNDDLSPTPRVFIADTIVDEEAGLAQFIVRLSAASLNPVSLDFSTADGSARAGSDYVEASGTLNFLPGQMVKTITVDLVDDERREQDERFFLDLFDPSNATLGQDRGAATIIDNDAAPLATPVVSLEDVTVNEADGVARMLFRLSAPSELPVSVDWTTAGPGASANGLDFNAVSGVMTFAPGEVAKTALVTLDDNATAEGIEAFFLLLSNPVNAALGRSRSTMTIVDDDAASPTPRLSVANVTVDEAARAALVVVRLDAAANVPVTLSYETLEGTAREADYDAVSGDLTFLPGEVARTVRIGIVDDGRRETPESFDFRIRDAAGAEIGTEISRITVLDNDAAPAVVPSIAVRDVWATESEGLVTFDIALSAPSEQTVGVNWSAATGAGTANGLDFNAASGSIGFAPGEVHKSVQIVLDDNATAEAAETFFFSLSAPSNALIDRGSARATIIDDDAPAVAAPSFGLAPGFETSVSEGAQWVDVPVILSAPSPAIQRVAYRTVAGTATAEGDFVASRGEIAFLPGEMVKTLRVFLADDARFESLEAFRIVFSAPDDAPSSPLALPQSTTISIIDNETPIFGDDNGQTLRGDDLDNRIFGNGGDDRLYGLDGVDLLDGGSGDDKLYGGRGADRLYGGVGDDALDGGASKDRMEGGRGDDRYVVDNKNDRVVEAKGAGRDIVLSSIDYKLNKNVEKLTLTGGDKIDGKGNGLDNLIRGNKVGNELDGSRGDDRLYGGKGNDDLIGGKGQDDLTGGKGSDDFIFADISESGKGPKNRDVIHDFERGRDTIDLSAIDANENRGREQDFDFIFKQDFSGKAGELRFEKEILMGDVDGDGRADFHILVDGVSRLGNGDFDL